MLYIKKIKKYVGSEQIAIYQTLVALTRGDTAYLEVDITNSTDGSAYEMKETDNLVLTIRTGGKGAAGTETILTKQTNKNFFVLTPEDTADLEYKPYVYDVQLTTADGAVFTIIPESPFELLGEVT